MQGSVARGLVQGPTLRGQLTDQFVAGLTFTLGCGTSDVPTRQHQLGFSVKRADELTLPAVPHPRTHGSDVAHRQDGQHSQPLDALHAGGEVGDRLAIGQIARLRHHGQRQMLLDQPRNGFGLPLGQAEAGAQNSRLLRTRDRMVFRPPLRDVVQKARHGEHGVIVDLGQETRREGMAVPRLPTCDLSQNADGLDQMLVHREVVVHRELHHRRDAAEGRHEAPQHARLVHTLERFLRVARGRQDGEEQPVRLFVRPQLVVDQVEASVNAFQRVGVQLQLVDVGEVEQADQVHGVALEAAILRERDAAIHHLEIGSARQLAAAKRIGDATHQPTDHAARCLEVALLQIGAQNAGEIAHILGDREVVLHEALDRCEAVALAVRVTLEAHPPRNLGLQIEAQLLLGLAAQKVHVAAHGPLKVLGGHEHREFVRLEHAAFEQIVVVAHPEQSFDDPEQGLEVALAALALLNVRLDHVARVALPLVARVTLGQLVGDEAFGLRSQQISVNAPIQLVRKIAIAAHATRLEQGGADGRVLARQLAAFLHRTRGVTNLELEIPQNVEHPLDHSGRAFARGGRQQKQQVHVRAGRHAPTPIPAYGDHRDRIVAFARGMHMRACNAVQFAHDHVRQQRQRPCGARAPVRVIRFARLGALQQPGLDRFATALQGVTQHRDQRRSGLVRFGRVALNSGIDLVGQGFAIDRRPCPDDLRSSPSLLDPAGLLCAFLAPCLEGLFARVGAFARSRFGYGVGHGGLIAGVSRPGHGGSRYSLAFAFNA